MPAYSASYNMMEKREKRYYWILQSILGGRGGVPAKENLRSPVSQKIMYEKPGEHFTGFTTPLPSLRVPLRYALDAWANQASSSPTAGF